MSEHQPNDRRNGPLDPFTLAGLVQIVQMFYQAVRDFLHDSGPQWAAAVAYYSLLSLFPLLLAAVAIAATFVDASWMVEQATTLVGQYLPRGEGQIEQVIEEAVGQRGSAGLLSVAGLLWTGTRVFGAVTKALNIAYDVDETYGFFKRLLVELVMLLTVGLLFVVAVAARPLLGTLSDVVDGLPSGQVYDLVLALGPDLLLLLVFVLVYRYVPRRQVGWVAVLGGAATATALHVLARPLFTRYLNTFANYNLVYGSLAIVVIIVLWAWITAVILLYGGEVAGHIQAMLLDGESAEHVEQRHRDRAPT